MQNLPIRVLVQQRIMAPYRLSVFRALAAIPRLDVTYVYGQASEDSGLQSVLEPEGLKVIVHQNRFIGGHDTVILQFGLLKSFFKLKPDVLVLALNPRSVVNLILFKIAKWRGVPVVWWGHGIRPRGRFRKLYTKLCNDADATILYYPEGADVLEKLGVPKAKLFVAWNSIETEEIAELAAPYAQDREDIVYVGRLIPEKKVPLLIDGFEEAVKKYKFKGNLIIIGEGPDQATVEQKVSESPYKDRIQLKGAVYDQESLAPVFNRALVSVSPGYVGLSAIHALAFGVPMLAADDEPHSPEIIVLEEGKNSIFFKADSASDLADKLAYIEGHKDQMVKFSEAGQEHVLKTFSSEQMAQNMAKAIFYAAKGSAFMGSVAPMVCL